MLKRDTWDRADRTHLKRWAEVGANDPVWEKITADARKRGIYPDPIHEDLIMQALDARRIAEGVKAGNDPIFQERQKQRSELFALAEKADDLARYFKDIEKYPGIANFFQRFLVWPVTPEQAAVPRIESPFLRVQQLRAVHELEAKLLRQRAAREPKPTTRISRQPARRKYIAFMVFMANCVREMCRRPYYGAIATMTEIAFPETDTVTAEDVRKACGATTRLGRKKRAGTHNA